jgi:tRNA A-37 threonylcarbamoyl transferase component Bud32
MEKMDNHLSDLLELNKGKLSKKHQKRILHICKKLDKIGIFYDDPNILNFMLKNDTIYLIDYGMCKLIDDALIKKLNTKTPNQVYLKSAIIIKLKQANCDESSYNLLL